MWRRIAVVLAVSAVLLGGYAVVRLASGGQAGPFGSVGTDSASDERNDLVRLPGGEAGLGRGGWYGMRGIFEPYAEGKLFHVAFRLRNQASDPVTLLSATQPAEGRRLLRLIGVRFAPAPSHVNRSSVVVGFGMAPPYGAVEPKPVVVWPNGEASVQFNFKMGECEFFSPGVKRRYNETATFRYLIDGREQTTTLDLTGITITITAPPEADCPGQG